MTDRLDAWISPFDTYATIADAIADVRRIHMPGAATGVLLPTLYDDWTQAQVNHALGAELTVSSAEQAGQIRAAFEAQGVPCGGWSVPRGTGDVAAEGHAHGLMAAQFDFFLLNLEKGWPGFWTDDGRAAVDVWLGAFWAGVKEGGATARLNGNVGVTWVTNSAMMQAVSDAEAAAWVGGTNFDALEAYIPGDPGLDPSLSMAIWQARLARIGVSGRPVMLILEQGDLPALCAQHTTPGFGVQLWTLASAAQQTWPALIADAPSADAPERQTPSDWPWPLWQDAALNYRGIADALGPQVADLQTQLAGAQAALAQEQSASGTQSTGLAAQLTQTAADRDAATAERNAALAKITKAQAALA